MNNTYQFTAPEQKRLAVFVQELTSGQVFWLSKEVPAVFLSGEFSRYVLCIDMLGIIE